MRYAILLFAAIAVTSATAAPVGEAGFLNRFPARAQTLRLAAACESTPAAGNRVAAATLDILPCPPHHVAMA